MNNNKIKACMMGESVFKVGDRTSLAQRWNLYNSEISVEECMNMEIIEIYHIENDKSCLPSFKAKVRTNKNRVIEVAVEDLDDVRNYEENCEELNKVGYNFNAGSIYCKGYECENGHWKFFNIGFNDNINYTHSY